MTPAQATSTLIHLRESSRPATAPRPVVVTRSETVACTSPEPCERDHELD
jgi:hypothetical protein